MQRQSMMRVIIKQGYLKKLPNSARIGASFKGPTKRWFVFGVQNDKDPYLEYYENEEGIFKTPPINMIFLNECRYVKENLFEQKYENVFTVSLPERILNLIAPSRRGMRDWCEALETKLTEMGILEGGGQNYYVDQRRRHSSSVLADCASSQNLSNQQRLSIGSMSGASAQVHRAPSGGMNGQNGMDIPPPIPARPGPQSVGSSPHRQLSRQDSRPLNIVPGQARPQEVASPPSMVSEPQSPWHPALPGYSATPPPPLQLPLTPHSGGAVSPVTPLQRSQSIPATPTSPLSCHWNPESPGFAASGVNSSADAFSLLPPKMREAMGYDDESPIFGYGGPPIHEEDAPPPYSVQQQRSKKMMTSMALKQSQVDILQREMAHPGGVKVVLRKVDCHHTIALVDCYGKIWVAGWMQKARPFLHNAFHIGDQLVSVNGQVVENSQVAQRLIKNCTLEDKITFIIKRAPNARVYAMKRNEPRESVGITRNGVTAEITDVEPYGMAARFGLTLRACTTDGNNFCNWWLTEINNRPLNLFFKENEIEHRLNAVGQDISIMVQPADFIKEIKKQLKAIKNYKDFLVY